MVISFFRCSSRLLVLLILLQKLSNFKPEFKVNFKSVNHYLIRHLGLFILNLDLDFNLYVEIRYPEDNTFFLAIFISTILFRKF